MGVMILFFTHSLRERLKADWTAAGTYNALLEQLLNKYLALQLSDRTTFRLCKTKLLGSQKGVDF